MNLKTKATQAAICSVTTILAIVFNIDDGLHVSENGLRHIANEEGCRSKAYQCSAHVWTVGLGHTTGTKPGMKATNKEIAEYFVQDVEQAEVVVNKHITQKPSQGEYDMMVSFVFNLGANNFTKSTLLKKFNQGDKSGACRQYSRWVYVDGQDCRLKGSNCAGIPKRRETEKNACLNGWG